MEIRESLKESGNTQRDNRSMIPNKIKNVEEEKIKSQILNQKKILNILLRNFKLESNDTENKRYQNGRKVKAIVT